MSESPNTVAATPSAAIMAAQDLFVPAAGYPPPLLAGRDAERRRIASVLRRPLQNSAPPKNAVLLHGVRGSGKTCLMAQAQSEFSPSVRVVDLDASDFLTVGALAREIVAQAMEGRDVPCRCLSFPAGVQVAGTGGHITIGRGEPAPERTITGVLGALKFCAQGVREGDDQMPGAPLLISIDEVQAVKGDGREDMLKDLLEGVQHACGVNARWPVGLIMAGTPDAYGHIRACGTFAERMVGSASRVANLPGGNIPLGGLDRGATGQALMQPLQSCGIGVDEAVLDLAWRETSGHPYFIQAFGWSLCDNLRERTPDTLTIDLPLAEAALSDFSELRRQRYEERRMELQSVGALEAALHVARAIFKEGAITSDHLDDLCNTGVAQRDAIDWSPALNRKAWGDAGDAAKDVLLHTGLIWGENGSLSVEYHFGIPSFAAHAVAYAATCGTPHLQAMGGQIDRERKAKRRAAPSLAP